MFTLQLAKDMPNTIVLAGPGDVGKKVLSHNIPV